VPQPIKIYASGPGLMLHSHDAVARLESGKNYTEDLGVHRGVAGELLSSGRIALISTGSPGLDYVLFFEVGPVTASIAKASKARTTFPFVVSGKGIEIRDSYVTLHWGDEDYACQRLTFPDGKYVVDVLWVPSQQHGEMVIHFFFKRTRSLPKACEGWINLDFKVR